MSRTESAMLALGTPAPEFQLPDVVSGEMVSLNDFKDVEGVLFMFICRHCPYVRHIQKGIAQLGEDYAAQPIGIIAISSNDSVAYPDDAPDSLRKMAAELGFKFPLCFDATQDVARAFKAACTPDFFLFDRNRRLVYRGQFDDSRPRNENPVTGRDVRAAMDALLQGQPVSEDQKPSLGCNIKWKPDKQ